MQYDLVVNDKVVGWAFAEFKGGQMKLTDVLVHESNAIRGVNFGVTNRDLTPPGPKEPTDPGFYRYSGGAQTILFLLRRVYDSVVSGPTRLQWNVITSNGEMRECNWKYIEQCLGVWELEKI